LGKPIADAVAFATAHHLKIARHGWVVTHSSRFPQAEGSVSQRTEPPANGVIVAGGNDSRGGDVSFTVDTVTPSNRSWDVLLSGASKGCPS
jgi:hypothetical protein